MSIEVKEVKTKQDYRAFTKFPYQLYRGNAYWIPPLFRGELQSLQAAGNPAFVYCEARFWLALNNGKCVGRVGAIINNDYNRKTGEDIGRISRIEFVNDPQVSAALFNCAGQWLRQEGMTAIHGPLGFSNLDNQGLLVEGFDRLPSVGSIYHFPYYKDHFVANGFQKENDWVEFRLSIREIPEKARRLTQMLKQRFGLRVIHFRSRKELLDYGARIFSLLNDSFTELPYVSVMSDQMKQFYMKKYLSSLTPSFVKAIENTNGETLAFVVSVPSLSKALQKAGGRLFPTGFYHLQKALKKNDTADLLLAGVRPDYQRQGLTAILMEELQTEMLDFGIKYVETTGIFETNQKAIEHWKNYDHIQHKRRRCYRKNL